MSSCCSPTRGPQDGPDRPAGAASPPAPVPLRSASDTAEGPAPVLEGMVLVPAGEFRMGNDRDDAFPDDGEGPVRTVYVSDFLIDATAVTNEAFAAFVDATGYRTEAERFGWSFVFDGLIGRRDRAAVMDGTVPGAPWWTAVRGADWAHPFGPHTGLDGVGDHPVVHVSWNDAAAYASWAGKRLPTEAEWEKACRGGLDQARFPWGDELEPGGEHWMNVWQGDFPRRNTGRDGYQATAPANAFPANGFGLYNTTGNVWEWTADRFSAHWHARDNARTRHDPQGPPAGPTMVLRGGSYLCHVSYCNRYRTAGRTQNTPDTSTGHMGFRCAATIVGTDPDHASPHARQDSHRTGR
ncbi:MAG TPA: formylglycine-generating enzyme family protein [Nakamurella sp.]|nr:formylglycine-generating enzyme family protein [Nakamurella sp.]